MSKGASTDELRTRMQGIDPYEFEDFVGELWEEEGWDTTVSQGSNDMGVDVIAEKQGTIGQKLAIQAKRYSEGNKVGRPKVQQYHSLKEQDTNADAAVVVTTSSFTDQAQLWAHDHNVKLVDGDDLVDMVRKHGREDLIEDYAPSIEEIESESGDGSSSTTSTSSSTSQTSATSSSNRDGGWFKAVSLGVGLQIAGALLMWRPALIPMVGPDAGLWILVAGWFFAPAAVFLDAWHQHKTGAEYQPNRLTWPTMAFMIPVIVPGWYFVRRV